MNQTSKLLQNTKEHFDDFVLQEYSLMLLFLDMYSNNGYIAHLYCLAVQVDLYSIKLFG